MRVSRLLKRMVGVSQIVVCGVEETCAGLVVDVRPRSSRIQCPCGRLYRAAYDRRERRWRHLDAATVKMWLRFSIRRVDCTHCGVRTEQVPWARPGARHTTAFENQTAWLVQRCDLTAVSMLMRVGWSTVAAIARRVVGDHLGEDRFDGLRRIGVDEISYRFGHRYLTIVVDHDTSRVVWIAKGKDRAAFESFFTRLGQQRARQLELISMDLGPLYRHVAQDHAPQAKVCLDPFHVMLWAGRALDTAVAAPPRPGETKPRGKAYTRIRAMLRTGSEKLSDGQREQINRLRRERWQVFRAWELKESLRDIYRIPPDQARAHFNAWLAAASRSRIPSMVQLGRRLRPHREGILAAIEHGLSNSRVEGTNARIRLLHRRGYGYHTAEALAALIYLCCSKLPIALPTTT